VPLQAMNACFCPAITRRRSPPSPLPRRPALAADECSLRLGARDAEARQHHLQGHRTSLRSVRGRFVELVEHQLELFETEYAGLIRDCEAALDAYDAAPRGEAEERYGDYVDLVDAARDALLEYRDEYARTLAEEAAEEYVEVFDRLVRSRLPRFGLELD